MFKASPRAWQVKSSSVPTPPPIQISGLVTQEVSTEHRWPRVPLLWWWGWARVDTQWLGWSLPQMAPTPEAPLSLLSKTWGPC